MLIVVLLLFILIVLGTIYLLSKLRELEKSYANCDNYFEKSLKEVFENFIVSLYLIITSLLTEILKSDIGVLYNIFMVVFIYVLILILVDIIKGIIFLRGL